MLIEGLERIAFDIRHAGRSLRRSPGFALLTILILALGIGANTAIFSLVSSILLRPLPFVEPDRLVVLWEDFTDLGGPPRVELAPATFVEWQRRSRSFDDMAMFFAVSDNLTGDGEPEQLFHVRTTTNLFSVLGLQPVLGRTLTADDEGAGAEPVAVISTELWQRRFNADPDVIGRTITYGGLNRTIVGVIPPDFRFPNEGALIWIPGQFSPEFLAADSGYFMYAVARLAPSVTLAEAQAELSTIARTIGNERGAEVATGASVAPLQEQIARSSRPTLYILLAAAGTVLLITCANVANLLLARGTVRVREFALRQALGSNRRRVVQQLLTESGLLALAGVIAGLVLSTFTFAYLGRLLPENLPAGVSPEIDGGVLSFSIVLALLTVLLFGTGPALVAARRDFSDALKQAAGQVRSGDGRMRKGLVVAEIALTVVLLTAAGLLLRSYTQLLDVDPGFESENLLLGVTPLSADQYREPQVRYAFYDEVLGRIRNTPGVVGAEFVNFAPLVFDGGRILITIDGRPPPPPEEFGRYITSDRIVTDGYLSLLGVPLLSGRYLDERDTAAAPFSVIINSAMAELHWPGQDPLGARLRMGGQDSDTPWYTVVGVVGDMRHTGLDEAPEAQMYFSYQQPPNAGQFSWPQYLVVRTDGDPMGLANVVRRAVWAADPNQPVANVRTMDAVLSLELRNRNTQMTLVGAFAVLALLLAAVGLYGVLAYTVAQRGREIGLRMALGAQRASVVGGVIRHALLLALIGVGIGLALAFLTTRLLDSFLFDVSATDPSTFVIVSVLLIAVTLVASFVPARRAAVVDPIEALRAE